MFRCLERSLQIVFELESPPSAKGYAKVSNISRATSMLKPLVETRPIHRAVSKSLYGSVSRPAASSRPVSKAWSERHGRGPDGPVPRDVSSVRGAGHVVTGFYILVRATVTVRSRWSRGCLEVA